MPRLQVWLSVLLLMLGTPCIGRAQEKKSWNPFSSSANSSTTANDWGTQGSSQKAKKSTLLSWWSSNASANPAKKSEGWWSRTTATLNPFDGKSTKASQKLKPKPEKKGWLFGGQAETQASSSPRTLKQFFEDGEPLSWP